LQRAHHPIEVADENSLIGKGCRGKKTAILEVAFPKNLSISQSQRKKCAVDVAKIDFSCNNDRRGLKATVFRGKIPYWFKVLGERFLSHAGSHCIATHERPISENSLRCKK